MKAAGFSEEHMRLVNEILEDLDTTGAIGAMGAYCLGIGSAAAFAARLEPTRNMLQTCANCRSVDEAVEFSQRWIDHEFEQGPKKGSFR